VSATGGGQRDAHHATVAGAAPTTGPRLSVVVPSYQRAHALERVLEALRAQDAPPGSYEVLVVLDGSTDGSAELLETWVREERLPGLRWHRQENAGQSAARDAGVRLAAAPVVLFVDDDVVASPGLVARHLAWHAAGERVAVLGDCEIVPDGRAPDVPPSLYMQFVRIWWEDMYRVRALPGRVSSFRDFCAGNVSLRRDDYLAVGGFDRAFRGYGGEDYELGYRLLRAGVRFVPDREAHADHYHRQHVRSAFVSSHQEGIADVYLGRKHPELRAGLRVMHLPTQGALGRLARLAFTAPWLEAPLARAGGVALDLFERLHLRGRWHRLHLLLRGHAYWCGVREALGTREALAAYQREATVPEQTLELAQGLPPLEALGDFWVHGPSRLRVTWDGEPIAMLHLSLSIEEPLRPFLARWLATRLPGSAWLGTADGRVSPFDLAVGPGAAR
jgi:GT2 family glycosyltransferase